MKILIAPYSQKLRNGRENAKNYPFWPQLIEQLKLQGHTITLAPTKCSMKEMEELTRYCDIYICVDTFLQHVGQYLGKRGIVIWTVSDPALFGYPNNINLLKHGKFLRPNQYDTWENTPYNKDAAIDIETVLRAVDRLEDEL